MKRHTNILLLLFIVWTACSNPMGEDKQDALSSTSLVDLTNWQSIDTLPKPEPEVQKEFSPIHGELDQRQIDQYYSNILDTLEDRRIIGSELIGIISTTGMYVSMLHNTGTSDQMFLCTHDKNFNLLDSYFIGTRTMFDKTSHTIEYQKISDDHLEFHHIDWGYGKENVDNEIDTLNYKKYILTVTEVGKIEKI